MNKKIVSLVLSLILMVGIMGTGCLEAHAGSEKVVIKAGPVKSGEFDITVNIQNATFNVVQLALDYDNENLSFISDNLKNEFGLDGGYLSKASSNFEPGKIEYTLYVEPGTEGPDKDGFLNAPASGSDVVSFHFKVKSGGKIYTDSIRPKNVAGMTSGIRVVTKGTGQDGNAIAVDNTSDSLLLIDLSAADAKGKMPSKGTTSNASNAGNAGNTGNASNAGAGGTATTSAPATAATTTTEKSNTLTETGKATMTDINNHWAKASIENLVSKNIIKGYADGSFSPNKGLSRAEFAVIITRALKMDTTSAAANTFTDTNTHWAKNEIAAVFSKGYVKGDVNGAFAPNEGITREQLVTIVCRAKGITPITKTSFVDDNSISSWAKGYVYAAQEMGIIGGYADGTFGPDKGITRAEMSKIVEKIL